MNTFTRVPGVFVVENPRLFYYSFFLGSDSDREEEGKEERQAQRERDEYADTGYETDGVELATRSNEMGRRWGEWRAMREREKEGGRRNVRRERRGRRKRKRRDETRLGQRAVRRKACPPSFHFCLASPCPRGARCKEKEPRENDVHYCLLCDILLPCPTRHEVYNNCSRARFCLCCQGGLFRLHVVL